MVTGGPEVIRNHPDMETGIRDEITYCSPSTSSGKRKKARSTSQPKFRSENTFAIIEADDFFGPSTIGPSTTIIQPISTTTPIESRNCPNLSQLQCPQ